MATAGCLALALTCVTADSAPPSIQRDPYAALRGLLLEPYGLVPPTVRVDAPVELPVTAPAYRIEPPRTEDLRALAERYAGGPVIEGKPARFSEDSTGFDTGDGWFSYYTPRT